MGIAMMPRLAVFILYHEFFYMKKEIIMERLNYDVLKNLVMMDMY